MPYHWLADLVLLVHFGFLLFVILGGLAVLRWRRLAWVHLPAAAWGVLIEWAGWICPLTPLEISLRRRAGQAGYGGGFIDHYVTALMYPEGLSRAHQVILGTLALAVNLAIYARLCVLWRRSRRRRITAALPRGPSPPPGSGFRASREASRPRDP